MSRFAPKTLRRMPPATREIARLANELASVQTRLANRIDGLVSMEMMARASQRVFCNNAAHAALVSAALRYLKAIDDPALGPGARTDALMALQAAAAHFDPDKLFEDADGPEPQGCVSRRTLYAPKAPPTCAAANQSTAQNGFTTRLTAS